MYGLRFVYFDFKYSIGFFDTARSSCLIGFTCARGVSVFGVVAIVRRLVDVHTV